MTNPIYVACFAVCVALVAMFASVLSASPSTSSLPMSLLLALTLHKCRLCLCILNHRMFRLGGRLRLYCRYRRLCPLLCCLHHVRLLRHLYLYHLRHSRHIVVISCDLRPITCLIAFVCSKSAFT